MSEFNYEECVNYAKRVIGSSSFISPEDLVHDAILNIDGEITNENIIPKIKSFFYTEKSIFNSALRYDPVGDYTYLKEINSSESDRQCKRCNKVKNIHNFFPIRATVNHGRITFTTMCRECCGKDPIRRKATKKYMESERGRYKTRKSRQKYYKKNISELKAYAKEYRATEKGKMLAKKRHDNYILRQKTIKSLNNLILNSYVISQSKSIK